MWGTVDDTVSPLLFSGSKLTDSRYQQALDYIYSFIDYERLPGSRSRVNYDLRRMDELLERLGNPHLKSRTIHIAGTKGKGSVAAMIASALTASGYITGLFTSPHLHFYNERIMVNGAPIPDEELVDIVEKVKPEIEAVNRDDRYGQLTTFEITTAIGFTCFAERNVDFQVIEVGLGGRLDATNVVHPDVCVITAISYDHTEVLGNTLAEIAGEKAGIIKPGSVVISSPQAEEADLVIKQVCHENQARLVKVGRDITHNFIGSEYDRQSVTIHGNDADYNLTIPLLGKHQLDNAAVSIAVLEALVAQGFNLTAESIKTGLENVKWEARLQILNRNPLVIADGAHNTESAMRLRQAIEQYFKYKKAILIIGLSADKNSAGIFSELVPIFDTIIVTRSIHPRAMSTDIIVKELSRQGIQASETDDISTALPLALQMAGEEDLICVTGSLFVAAGAIEQITALGLSK